MHSYLAHLSYGSLLLTMYTCAMSATHPTTMLMAMMGKFTRAKSSLLTRMCLRARISRHSRPASDAEKAALKAP